MISDQPWLYREEKELKEADSQVKRFQKDLLKEFPLVVIDDELNGTAYYAMHPRPDHRFQASLDWGPLWHRGLCVMIREGFLRLLAGCEDHLTKYRNLLYLLGRALVHEVGGHVFVSGLTADEQGTR